MQHVTLAIGVVVFVAVLRSRATTGLLIYFAVIVWYPQYLSVKLGTVDFTLSRIAILAVYLKLLLETDTLRRFRWSWLDRLVVASAFAEVVAGLMAGSDLFGLLENRSGAAFDSILPYFAVRMTITSRREYLTLLKGVLGIMAPLAIVGAYESTTGHNPFGFLEAYSSWPGSGAGHEPRHGFYRAGATSGNCIMFGLLFAMTGPWCAGLWKHVRQYRVLLAGCLLLTGAGLASSVSSGPILVGMVAIPVMALYPMRRQWWLAVAAGVLSLAAIDILSNRHWYYVLASYGTFSSETAYYRIELIKEAFGGGMGGHWLFGYGADVGLGGSELVWEHNDITNHYILILIRYGLLALVPFLAGTAAAFASLRRAFSAARSDADRWLVWCLVSSLLGMLAGMFSVGLLGQVMNLYYMLLGLCGAVAVVDWRGMVERTGAGGAEVRPALVRAQHGDTPGWSMH